MSFTFEWDDEKAAENLTKHGVSFSEASTVFADPLSRTILDPLHSEEEERLVILGQSGLQHTLVVVHTYRGEVIRIISARAATSREREIMSEEKNEEVEMLDEYDFSNAVIGKYAKQYAEGTNIVVLEPDVARVFPDSAAVNQALRQLIEQRSR